MSIAPLESTELYDIVAVGTAEESSLLTVTLVGLADWIDAHDASGHNPDKNYRAMRATQLAAQFQAGFTIVEPGHDACLAPGYIAGVDRLLVEKAIALRLRWETDEEVLSLLEAVSTLLDDQLALVIG